MNAAQNVPAIVKTLLDAGNQDVTAVVIPGVNHLLQPCQTGGVMEYAFIQTTVDERVLNAVGDWLLGKAGKKP